MFPVEDVVSGFHGKPHTGGTVLVVPLYSHLTPISDRGGSIYNRVSEK